MVLFIKKAWGNSKKRKFDNFLGRNLKKSSIIWYLKSFCKFTCKYLSIYAKLSTIFTGPRRGIGAYYYYCKKEEKLELEMARYFSVVLWIKLITQVEIDLTKTIKFSWNNFQTGVELRKLVFKVFLKSFVTLKTWVTITGDFFTSIN